MMDLSILAPDLREERLQKEAQEDYIAFCKRMNPNYDAAPHIVEKLAPMLIKAMITPNYRGIITMPPRHSKSMNVSENGPAFYLGLFPQNRVIAASNTGSLAQTFARRVRNKVASDRFPFTDVKIADDKGAIQAWDVTYKGQPGGGYYSVGVGGTPTGHGANLIIIDDPIRNAADADSFTVRESLWEWFSETMYTRLEPEGSIIITATRWHDDDLTGRILKNSEEHWEHLHLPAIDEEGNALWPTRWPVKSLDRIRKAVGSRAWSAQYQGTPVLESGSIIKQHWLKPYLVRPHNIRIIQSWDTAYEVATQNDYSVCTTIGYNQFGRYILDVYREKLEYPDLKRQVRYQYLKWHPQVVLIERASAGRSLLHDFNAENADDPTKVPVIGIEVETIKNWKEVRVHELTPVFEAGRIQVPETAPWLGDFMDEITRFPLATHDDQVDSLAQGLRWLEKSGMNAITYGSWLPDSADEEDEEYIDRRFA